MGNTVFGLISFSAVVLQGVLITFLLRHHGLHNRLFRAFLYAALVIVVWNAGYTVLYFTDSVHVATRAYNLSALGWAALPAVLAYFSLQLRWEFQGTAARGRPGMVMVAGTVFLMVLGVRGKLLAYRLEPAAIGWIEHIDGSNPATLLYLGLAIASAVYSAVVVTGIWKRSVLNRHRLQIRFIVLPALVAALLALVVNIFLPILGIHSIPPLGNIAMAVWTAFVGYALVSFPLLSVSGELAADAVLAHMRDMVILVDHHGRIQQVNPAVRNVLGFTSQQLVSRHLKELIPRESDGFLESAGTTPEAQPVVTAYSAEEEEIPCSLVVRQLHDRFLDPVGYVVLLRDIRQMQQLEKDSQTDHLTGLVNRRYMDQILAQEMARFQRYERHFSLIILDVDHFKSVNDTYGHVVGDQVLIHVSRTVRDAVRATDTAARWGGEEFLVLCPETPLAEAGGYAERIRQRFDGIPLEQGLPGVTVSFGVAMSRQDDSVDSLVHRADAALYLAKERGRNRVVLEQDDERR